METQASNAESLFLFSGGKGFRSYSPAGLAAAGAIRLRWPVLAAMAGMALAAAAVVGRLSLAVRAAQAVRAETG